MNDAIENHPVFVLTRPQMGENIGAAARAMANFGMTDLRLVAPRDGWPNERAESLASKAFTKVNVTCFDTLAEALADVHYAYATTARDRDMAKPVFTPHDAAGKMHGRTAFVFGPERTGLENDDLALCQAIINVPTDPEFSSLNLGQCVLLLAYELSGQIDVCQQNVHENDAAPAEMAEFDHMFGRLESALEAGGFFVEDTLRPRMVRNIRTTLLRSGMSAQEVRTFQGMISALSK